jgi:hypothetical protein
MTVHALLRKILWKKKTKWELAIASAGFLLGLGIFLIAIHVYLDLDAILDSRLAEGKKPDYLVISKSLGKNGQARGGGTGFSDEEIDALVKKDFVLDTGRVLANDFEAEATMSIFGQGFRTMLFFEAVPDRFLDVLPKGWETSGANDTLPVMISRDFLLLYNFGFAQSRNFPLLSEDLLKIVPVSLTIHGGGKSMETTARIVGLSDRIASILIPYNRMEALNAEFGSGESREPSRLVISVNDRTNPDIIRSLEENAYETSKEKLRLSDAGFTVRTIVSVVASIGIILLVLSFTVFLTTFRLIISRAAPEVALLVDLGYSKKIIAANCMNVLVIVFIAITVVTAGLVFGSVIAERSFLATNGFKGFGYFVYPVIPIAGSVVIAVSLFINYLSLIATIGKACG